jgi:hypothetical protein
MNDAIEFHDSTLAGIAFDGRDLVVSLAPAYVHRSAGRPGVDPGSGWLQDVDLVVTEAIVESSPSEVPVELCDGSLSVGEALWDNLLPLPLAASGATSLVVITGRGERLAVRGAGASIVIRGEPRYLEEVS